MVKLLTDSSARGGDIVTEFDKGIPSGVASLDSSGKLTSGQERVKITVGTTAPSSPAVGDVWIDTT